MAGILDLMNHVQMQGERGKQQGQQNRLNSLASQAYTAPADQQNSLLGQMAQVSPQAAQQQQGQFQQQGDRREQRLAGAAKYLLSAFERGDQAAVQGAYRTVLPEFQQLAEGRQLPETVDETILPMLHQVIAAANGGGSNSRVQSRFVGEDGQVYAMMADSPVPVATGIKADRQMWFRDHPGMAPELVGKDGSVMPVGQPQGRAPQGLPPAGGDQTSIIEQEIGRRLTPQERQQIAAGTFNLQVPAGEDLSHIPPLSTYTNPTQPAARPSEAQTAAEVERARQEAQLAYLAPRQAIETQGALDRKAGEAAVGLRTEQAEIDATRTRDASTALELIAEAERLLPNATGGLIGTARDAALGAFNVSTEGANATAQLQTIAGQLTSKMPRMQGPQSDKDVQLYKEMAGDLANPRLPVARRQAAAQQIRRLNEKYASQNPPQRDAAPSGDLDAILGKYGIR